MEYIVACPDPERLAALCALADHRATLPDPRDRRGVRHPLCVLLATRLVALAWTRLELRHAADQALARFSMANVKLKAFLELVLARLFAWDGLDRTLQKYPEALHELRTLGQIEPKRHCCNWRRLRGPDGPAPSGANLRDGMHRQHQDVRQVVPLGPVDPRILQAVQGLDQGRGHRAVHEGFSAG